MNTKHTTGQWKIYDTCLPARGIIEIQADGKVIANVKRLVTGKCYAASQCPEAEANAQRIVTCVNNFDKIAFDLQCAATDNLELKATNDALVIALKDLVRYSELLATKSHASKHAPIYEAKQLLNNINQK